MSRKRKNADVFADMCYSVQRRMFAFEYTINDEDGTAQLILDSVHRIKIGHLSLFPSVCVTYRQDDRRYVLQTDGGAIAMRHNAMLVEYDRMASFYDISDMSQLKEVIESVHRNATVCFHKIVKQGNVFIAVFTALNAAQEMRLNTGVLNDIASISSSWIELHPDTKELRLCVSLVPHSVPRHKRKRDDDDDDGDDGHDSQGCEDHGPQRQRARLLQAGGASPAVHHHAPPSAASSLTDATRPFSMRRKSGRPREGGGSPAMSRRLAGTASPHHRPTMFLEEYAEDE